MTTICEKCLHAWWHRTKNGRLHPDGRGECTWTLTKVMLPVTMYSTMENFNFSLTSPCGRKERARVGKVSLIRVDSVRNVPLDRHVDDYDVCPQFVEKAK